MTQNSFCKAITMKNYFYTPAGLFETLQCVMLRETLNELHSLRFQHLRILATLIPTRSV